MTERRSCRPRRPMAGPGTVERSRAGRHIRIGRWRLRPALVPANQPWSVNSTVAGSGETPLERAVSETLWATFFVPPVTAKLARTS